MDPSGEAYLWHLAASCLRGHGEYHAAQRAIELYAEQTRQEFKLAQSLPQQRHLRLIA